MIMMMMMLGVEVTYTSITLPPLLRPGMALLRRDEKILVEDHPWTLLRHQDFKAHHEALEQIRGIMAALQEVEPEGTGKVPGKRNPHQEAIIAIMRQRIAAVARQMQEVLGGVHQNPKCPHSKRTKRGAIDGVGKLLHSLFGVMDSDNELEVRQIGTKQLAIAHQLGEQTTILSGITEAMKIANKEVTRLDSQIRGFSIDILGQIEKVKGEIQVDEKLAHLEAIFEVVESEIKGTCQIVLETLTGRVSPRLLTHSMVNEVLTILGNKLGQSFIKVIMETAQVTVCKCDREIIYSITLHIPKADFWELAEVIATPVILKGKIVAIRNLPAHIAQKGAVAIELESQTLRERCVRTRELYVCPREVISYKSAEQSCVCLLERMSTESQRIPPVCELHYLDEFIPLYKVYNDQNDLLYSVQEQTPALLKCSSGEVRPMTLKGTGYLHLPNTCSLSINKEIEIYGRRKGNATTINFTSVQTNYSGIYNLFSQIKPDVTGEMGRIKEKLNHSMVHWGLFNASLDGVRKSIDSINRDSADLFGRADQHYVAYVNSWVSLTLAPLIGLCSLSFLFLWKWRQSRKTTAPQKSDPPIISQLPDGENLISERAKVSPCDGSPSESHITRGRVTSEGEHVTGQRQTPIFIECKY